LEARAAKIREESEAAIASLQQQKAASEAAVRNAKRELAAIQGEKESMEAAKRALEGSLDSMRQEQEAMKASLESMQENMAGLKREKELLESRLQDALSHVADTRESARGFIVNLPDILFDVNQAALKPGAKIVLAKLAGILLIMQDLNLRIEGHTDSTGSASYNLELSQRRSESVMGWLAEEGLSSERMSAYGYGFDRPIADNSSAEGRKQNRRVEIIISEGEIQEDRPPVQ
jgi:outer membrane protein OmpA-like peptidoglycan-associated protein